VLPGRPGARLLLLVPAFLAGAASPVAASQRFVVVPRDTPLFIQPDRGAEHAVAGRSRGEADYVVLRDQGKVEGGFRAVALARHGDCYDAWTLGIDVRFYVPADAVATVLARQVVLRFPDGTAALLDAGVVVAPARQPERLLVRVAPATLSVPADRIPKDALGNFYETPAAEARLSLPDNPELQGAGIEEKYTLRPGTLARLDGRPLRIKANLLDVLSDERGGVRLSSTCIAMDVRVPRKSAVSVPMSSPRGRTDSASRVTVACSVEVSDFATGRAHTELAHIFLRNGEEIGVVDGCLALGKEVTPVGSRRCFLVYLDGRRPGAKPLQLCFDPDAIHFHP
jgi:hypothetical protein